MKVGTGSYHQSTGVEAVLVFVAFHVSNSQLGYLLVVPPEEPAYDYR